MVDKPKVNSSLAEQEMDKAQKQFDAFDQNVKSMTMDRMNCAPKLETESQTKISQSDARKIGDTYLKPFRSIGSRDKFNEAFRDAYNYHKEYIQFIAENNEIVGEDLEIWTRPYGGMPAEWWKVPVNKPVWGPRYLKEQIARKYYHRMVMTKSATSSEGVGEFYGSMAAETTIARLKAEEYRPQTQVFMGSNRFAIGSRGN